MMRSTVLLLLLALSISTTTTDGFACPTFSSGSRRIATTPLHMSEATPATADGSEAESKEPELKGQAMRGVNGDPLPETYVKCGRCKSCYAILPEDLGPTNGCRIECTICGNNWFQTKDRVNTLGEGFEMLELPQYDRERIELNLKENKDPGYLGEGKLYVGNLAWECDEDALHELFSTVGNVGEAFVVRGDDGRGRGFAFVTMRSMDGFQNALDQMNGIDFMGRTLTVKESTKR